MNSKFAAAGLGLALAGAIAAHAVQPAMPSEAPGADDPSRIAAGTYTVDANHTQIVFEVDHLGFNPYFGIFGGTTGTLTIDPANPSAASVQIEIPLASIVTTSADLNAHLATADFFDTTNYPTATFRSTSVAIDPADPTKAAIAGELGVRGRTIPVVLDAQFTGAGASPMTQVATIGFHATTTVRRSALGMDYGIPMVSDEVELEITAAFEKTG
ncbi:MAG: YceI family protein [Sphingomonadaceae bacterium]|nr:YceI family protein [Sphingomonadaceae bacterium]